MAKVHKNDSRQKVKTAGKKSGGSLVMRDEDEIDSDGSQRSVESCMHLTMTLIFLAAAVTLVSTKPH